MNYILAILMLMILIYYDHTQGTLKIVQRAIEK